MSDKDKNIVEEWECGECGADVSEDDTVCPKCGADVSEVEEEEKGEERKERKEDKKEEKKRGEKLAAEAEPKRKKSVPSKERADGPAEDKSGLYCALGFFAVLTVLAIIFFILPR